ncbi:hypothetical protein XENOCAPTIV_020309, partial [Xenoophorus captivus]
LVAARNRLLESEREKSELASVAQQQLKEMENLRRMKICSDCETSAKTPGSKGVHITGSKPHTTLAYDTLSGLILEVRYYLLRTTPQTHL